MFDLQVGEYYYVFSFSTVAGFIVFDALVVVMYYVVRKLAP
jgi:uncharacterized membrane protein